MNVLTGKLVSGASAPDGGIQGAMNNGLVGDAWLFELRILESARTFWLLIPTY